MLALRRRDRDPESTAAHTTVAAHDSYLTDGSRLFRVAAPLAPDLGIESAVLEDCMTLAWRSFSAAEMWWLRLRTVTPAGTAAQGRRRASTRVRRLRAG